MSYPRGLDEMDEEEIRGELRRRAEVRASGKCDYCERPPGSSPCRFPERHRPDPAPAPILTGDASLDRLVRWLVTNPGRLEEVARALRLPLPRCEGHAHPCENLALWMTSAMTAYEWDGEDPNRPRVLCPRCSAGYREDWQERWDEYRSSVLP